MCSCWVNFLGLVCLQILARKRREYRDMVPDYYDLAASGMEQSGEELGALRQVWPAGVDGVLLARDDGAHRLAHVLIAIYKQLFTCCCCPSSRHLNILLLQPSMACLPSSRLKCPLTARPCPAQVAVDVPRTAPGVPFFHQPQVQKSLERILYIWGIRHVFWC